MSKLNIGDVVTLNGDGAGISDFPEAIIYVESGGQGMPHAIPANSKVTIVDTRESDELGTVYFVHDELTDMTQGVLAIQIKEMLQ